MPSKRSRATPGSVSGPERASRSKQSSARRMPLHNNNDNTGCFPRRSHAHTVTDAFRSPASEEKITFTLTHRIQNTRFGEREHTMTPVACRPQHTVSRQLRERLADDNTKRPRGALLAPRGALSRFGAKATNQSAPFEQRAVFVAPIG